MAVTLTSFHLLGQVESSSDFLNIREVFRNNVDFFNNFTMLCSMVIKLYQCFSVSFCHLLPEFGLVLMTLHNVIRVNYIKINVKDRCKSKKGATVSEVLALLSCNSDG